MQTHVRARLAPRHFVQGLGRVRASFAQKVHGGQTHLPVGIVIGVHEQRQRLGPQVAEIVHGADARIPDRVVEAGANLLEARARLVLGDLDPGRAGGRG